MYKCRKCGCNCDNADIRNGLCDDCRNGTENQADVLYIASKTQAKRRYIVNNNKYMGCINTSRNWQD